MNDAGGQVELVSWGIPPGTELLERYRILEKLGDGAVASVYRAQDRAGGPDVALKILDPLRVTDPVSRERFRRELEVLRMISHPGVARAIGAGNQGELEVLVLDLIEGETLAEKLRRGRLAVPEARAIGQKLAEAVAACHLQGILHRDLKPANVVIHPDRGPVILDFGMAWFSAAANLTRTGAVIGTPQYMAPEVLRSALADPRADLYALGAILFEMLAGRPPHLATSTDALALAQKKGPPPRLFQLRPEVGPELSEIVARALAQNPEDRWATASELAEALAGRRSVSGPLLDPTIACPSCGASRIVHLPLCPGCGEDVAWSLAPGDYAVRIDAVADPHRARRWLEERHRDVLRVWGALLIRRLHYLPAPLAVGVSQASARQLISEASAAQVTVTLVHSRSLGGPRLLASPATTFEMLGAMGLHLLLVLITAVILRSLPASVEVFYAMPAAYGIAGVAAAALYARRAILRVNAGASSNPSRTLEELRGRLRALQHGRSRRLASAAIARAAPLLLRADRGRSLDPDGLTERALMATLAHVTEADVHLSLILARPRSALAQDLAQAEARAAAGDARALDRMAELEVEKQSLVEAGILHDQAVRSALLGLRDIADAEYAVRQAEASLREA